MLSFQRLSLHLPIDNPIPHESHNTSQRDGKRSLEPEPGTAHKSRSTDSEPPRVLAQLGAILMILIEQADFPEAIHRCEDQAHSRGMDTSQAALQPFLVPQLRPHAHGANGQPHAWCEHADESDQSANV
jgi:hypothetical protein